MQPKPDYQPPVHRVRRSLMALLLGLFTWWGVGHWLEPGPLWTIPFAPAPFMLEPKLEDPTGRWLVTLERPANARQQESTSAKTSVVILEATTGKPVTRLSSHDISHYTFSFWQVKLLNDKLWWFHQPYSSRETVLELHCWEFLKESKDKVVQRWPLAMHEPVHAAFAEGASPRFVIQSTLPWELSLIAQGFSGWTMLTNSIVQGHEKPRYEGDGLGLVTFPKDREIALKTESMPLVSTYTLPTNPQEKPELLASWTLPRGRWNIPVIGPDLTWLAWSDCTVSSRTCTQPAGIMLFDGLAGKPLTLPKSCKQESGLQICYAFGSILVVDSDNSLDGTQSHLIEPGTGIELKWPEQLTQVPWKWKGVQWEASNHPRVVIVNHNIGCLTSPLYEYQVFEPTADGLQHWVTAIVPESVNIIGISRPSWFVQNQVVYEHYEPSKLPWWRPYLKDWSRLATWIERWTSSSDRNVVVLQADTGKLLKQIPDAAVPQYLTSQKQMYLMKLNPEPTGVGEAITGLEAWALPLVFWSVWWSRGAGLAVVLLVLFWSTSRHRQRGV